jgi:archaellum component FlaC
VSAKRTLEDEMTFFDWLENNSPFGGEYLHEYAKQAWDAREPEIVKLKEQIKDLEASILRKDYSNKMLMENVKELKKLLSVVNEGMR